MDREHRTPLAERFRFSADGVVATESPVDARISRPLAAIHHHGEWIAWR